LTTPGASNNCVEVIQKCKDTQVYGIVECSNCDGNS
jgi:hypothetical protein